MGLFVCHNVRERRCWRMMWRFKCWLVRRVYVALIMCVKSCHSIFQSLFYYLSLKFSSFPFKVDASQFRKLIVRRSLTVEVNLNIYLTDHSRFVHSLIKKKTNSNYHCMPPLLIIYSRYLILVNVLWNLFTYS